MCAQKSLTIDILYKCTYIYVHMMNAICSSLKLQAFSKIFQPEEYPFLFYCISYRVLYGSRNNCTKILKARFLKQKWFRLHIYSPSWTMNIYRLNTDTHQCVLCRIPHRTSINIMKKLIEFMGNYKNGVKSIYIVFLLESMTLII